MKLALAFVPIIVLGILGAGMMWRAAERARFILRTASFVPVPMEVLDFALTPLNVDGLAAAEPRDDKTSMVRVGYRYRVEGKAFHGAQVFPIDVEWVKPRVTPFALVADLGGGKFKTCFVDARHPDRAVLFRGWSPFLKSHVLGVGAGGLLAIATSLVLLVAVAIA